jgi:hypothetical protein
MHLRFEIAYLRFQISDGPIPGLWLLIPGKRDAV